MFNVLDQKAKYISDGYCQWCEKDFDENEKYPEYVMQAHTNGDDEWVWFVMHKRCYLQSHQYDLI
jgi:hypothetical protein